MEQLVERIKSADGVSYPDWTEYRDGIVVHENTDKAAVKAYARRVLGGDDLTEGDVYTIVPLPAPLFLRVDKRTVSHKLAAIDEQDVFA